MNLKKLLIIVTAAIIIAAYFFFDPGQYINLAYLKNSQERFRMLYGEHKVAVIAAYMVVCILFTALALPGAAIMTLAGGALFGVITGTLIVSFSSTIGATLACFISRYLLRDWVLTRFGDRFAKLHKGIEEEGPFYLFSLRLVPVFPFFIINLIMGLTHMSLGTFYWVSQIGMLPGTIIYVIAGRELSKIESVSGILSPGVILSFVLLGLFPLATKKILGWYKLKKRMNGHSSDCAGER